MRKKASAPRGTKAGVGPAAVSAPRGADTEYMRGWHAGVEAAQRVAESYVRRGRKVSVRERQEAAPAILGALMALAEPQEKMQ